MSRLFSLLFTLALLLAVSIAVPVLLTLDRAPAVTEVTALAPADLDRANNWLKANGPNRQRTGGTRVEFSASELRLAANYLLQRRWQGSAADILLSPERMSIQLSGKLIDNPLASHANLGLDIEEDQGLPRLVGIRLGQTRIPLELDAKQLHQLLSLLFGLDQLPLPRGSYQAMQLEQDRLVVDYRPIPGEISTTRRGATLALDPETLAVYGAELSRNLQHRAQPRAQDLAGLLPGLFRVARERTAANGDPVSENRHALVVLGLYALGADAKLFPAAATLPRWSGPWARLQGREDLSRHFLVSAALAALADAKLADLAGGYKEWRDAQQGKGFSLVDLAADRAGTRLGELATGAPGLARQVQDQMRTGLRDDDLLPSLKDLPDNLSEQRLDKTMGPVGGERYRQVIGTIDQRLETLPLYRIR